MPLEVEIAPHAKEKFIERCLDRSLEKLAIKVWHEGETLKPHEMSLMLAKGRFKDQYWSSTYRKYQSFIFIYRRNTVNNKMTLITIVPA